MVLTQGRRLLALNRGPLEHPDVVRGLGVVTRELTREK